MNVDALVEVIDQPPAIWASFMPSVDGRSCTVAAAAHVASIAVEVDGHLRGVQHAGDRRRQALVQLALAGLGQKLPVGGVLLGGCWQQRVVIADADSRQRGRHLAMVPLSPLDEEDAADWAAAAAR